MNGRPYHVHIIDRDGYIINSTLSREDNVTGKEVIGTYVGEHLNQGDVLPFLDKIQRCLTNKSGCEVCTYGVKFGLYLGKMRRISSDRVRMYDYNITDMDMEEVMKLM